MEADFYAILTSHGALTNVVPAEQMFPTVFGQATPGPALRYTKIDGVTGLHMQGSDGLSSSLMQIDIRAAVEGSASAYRDLLAVRKVFVGSHGVGGLLHPYRGIKGATDFRLIQLRSDRGVQHDKTGPQEFYTTSLDFDVWSRAAAA